MAVFILAVLPFHAFLTVWLSSLTGHYTLLRLWKEFLLLPIMASAIYALIKDKSLRQKLVHSRLVQLITLYIIFLVLLAIIPLLSQDVTAKAMWYGLLVNLRFLLFFLAVFILATKSQIIVKNWPMLFYIPAIIVAAFAILQYLALPYDFLRHFGYSESTIYPYETINHNIQLIRVASTTRGANPLGAYLLLPISALAVAFFKEKKQRTNILMLGLGFLLALAFSFSRSAWIGAALSLLLITWAALKTKRARKILLLSLAGIAMCGIILALVLRNNADFQNTFLHTEHGSKVAVSSNEAHGSAFKAAAKDIIHQPWGGGVGTAGPESVYNNHPARIAENYFLQIGQEAGVIGMALFIAICSVAGRKLWKGRADPLALWLFASLIGLTFVNLLSHAWTDDTLAYIWWGLAGVALATPAAKS